MQIKLPLPPALNSVYRVGKGRMYKSKEAKEYADEVGWIVKGKRKLEGDIYLDIMFHVKRDRDIDSGLKVLLDALEGHLYENDKQIKALRVEKLKSKEPLTILSYGAYAVAELPMDRFNKRYDHKKNEPF